MTGAHNITLAVFAVLIAVAASYTALDLASRVKASVSWLAYLSWLGIAAVCMGGGIWSMHFVAMLSYTIPGLTIAYDPYLTALSLFMAIAVTGIGFTVASRPDSGPVPLVLSGLFMGTGILAMHYIGMAAMRMEAMLRYDVTWVLVSVFIAMAAAIAALWLAFRSDGFIDKGIAACFMGAAISGMHFAGMKAANFSAHHMDAVTRGSGAMEQDNLALAVTTITFLILFAAVIAAMFDRRLAALVEHESLMLKKREEQFRSLYRRTPLPLHALDELGRIEEVSDAWLSLLGYTREEVIGRPLINFMVEESARRRVQHDWPTLLAEGEIREIEYRLVTRKGQFLDVLSTSRVERDAQGRLIWVVGGLVDVTARKRAEEALRQSQKMEAVGQLTGGIAHDFNNLLAVIMGSLEMLKKRLPADERLTRMVNNAMEGARRGATLTQRMLAFARRQALNPQPVDLSDLVKGMKEMLERSLGPKITIRTEFPLSLPKAVADPHQLEMALLNLAVNARDAMGGEGSITIAAEEAAELPPSLKPGPYLCLTFSDTGEGMDEETLARAQEPFFTTKGVGKGTGLGLPMVSGFAEQSGGTLVIRSRKGHGTTVEIWLPSTEAAARPAQPEEARPEGNPAQLLSGHKILLVDDDLLVLLSTQAMLEEMGAEVLPVASPMEALTVMRTTPDLACVLTDYAMPAMTGAQLAAAIKVERPDLPIVIATGYTNVPDEIAAFATIHKPFTSQALARTLAEALAVGSAKILPFRSGA
jgi:PAS domain S-box-containing protein